MIIFFDDTYAGERVVLPTTTANVLINLPIGFNGYTFIAECQVGGDITATFDLADQAKDTGMTMTPLVLRHGDSAQFFRTETTWEYRVTRAAAFSPEQGLIGSGNGVGDGSTVTLAWNSLFTPAVEYVSYSSFAGEFTLLHGGVYVVEVQTSIDTHGSITTEPFSYGTQVSVSSMEVLGPSRTYHSRNDAMTSGTVSFTDTFVVRGLDGVLQTFSVLPWLSSSNFQTDTLTTTSVVRIRKIAEYEAPLTVVNLLALNSFTSPNRGLALTTDGNWFKLTASTSELLGTGTSLVCDATAATSTNVDDFSYYTTLQTSQTNANYTVTLGVSMLGFATYHDLDLAIYMRMYPGDQIETSRVIKFNLHLGNSPTTSFATVQAKSENATTYEHTSSEFHQDFSSNLADGTHTLSVQLVNGILNATWDNSLPIITDLDLKVEFTDVNPGIFWRPGTIGIAMRDASGVTPTTIGTTPGTQIVSLHADTII